MSENETTYEALKAELDDIDRKITVLKRERSKVISELILDYEDKLRNDYLIRYPSASRKRRMFGSRPGGQHEAR
jgi:hypothetical protein